MFLVETKLICFNWKQFLFKYVLLSLEKCKFMYFMLNLRDWIHFVLDWIILWSYKALQNIKFWNHGATAYFNISNFNFFKIILKFLITMIIIKNVKLRTLILSPHIPNCNHYLEIEQKTDSLQLWLYYTRFVWETWVCVHALSNKKAKLLFF